MVPAQAGCPSPTGAATGGRLSSQVGTWAEAKYKSRMPVPGKEAANNPGGVTPVRVLDTGEQIDRHALGVARQVRQGAQHRGAIRDGLAHPEDPAATDVHPHRADMVERIEPVLVSPGADDALVIRLGRVQVVVVIIEPGLLEAFRLPPVCRR